MADKKHNNNRRNNDDDYNPRFINIIKKICPLTENKDIVLDYKNAEQIKKLINIKEILL